MDYTVEDIIMSLGTRVTELERRVANKRRTGVVSEVDHERGLYRVELSKQNGRAFQTPWIPARSLGAGGVKFDVLHTVGEQVDVLSENGDLTDAVVDLASYSNDNARENANTPLHIKIGDTVITASGDGVTIKAGKIVLDGEVHLGGEGGQLLHRKGDVDSDGDAAVGSASRVYAV